MDIPLARKSILIATGILIAGVAPAFCQTPVPTPLPGRPAAAATSSPTAADFLAWCYKFPDKPERPFPSVGAGTHSLSVPSRRCSCLIRYALQVGNLTPTSDKVCADQMKQAFWYQAHDPTPVPPSSSPTP